MHWSSLVTDEGRFSFCCNRPGVWQKEHVFWYYRLMTAHQAKKSSPAPADGGRGLSLTYETRIRHFGELDRRAGDDLLSAYAQLYGGIERKLFAETAAGPSAAALKSEYLERYRIPARMFNSVRVSLEGKIASVREGQKLRLDSLARRIARAERQIAVAAEQRRWAQVHQKQRRLGNLKTRLEKLEGDIAEDRIRLCFGSRRLWRKQYHLKENGYASHQEWLEEWQSARSDEFFLLGSRDETGGCQLCVATVADDGSP